MIYTEISTWKCTCRKITRCDVQRDFALDILHLNLLVSYSKFILPYSLIFTEISTEPWLSHYCIRHGTFKIDICDINAEDLCFVYEAVMPRSLTMYSRVFVTWKVNILSVHWNMQHASKIFQISPECWHHCVVVPFTIKRAKYNISSTIITNTLVRPLYHRYVQICAI